MATLQEQVVTVIVGAATAAAARVYGDAAPDRPTPPMIVYTQTPSRPAVVFIGAPPIVNEHYEIDCYATTKAGAVTLASQVKTALQAAVGASFKAVPTAEYGVYESEVKLHRVILEYSVWDR